MSGGHLGTAALTAEVERDGDLATAPAEPADAVRSGTRPRLGFLGVGWIGRNRMEALARSGTAEVAAIADPADETLAAALETVPDAEPLDSLEALLARELDGIVIATPSALHADQAIAALDAGLAVFCQKPIGRTRDEVAAVVDAARRADRLLGVDFSYRFPEAFRTVRDVARAGELGDVFAVDLTFHNAYGPDKSWFYDPAQAGGGCVMDLGIHLVDLVLWTLSPRSIGGVSSRLFAGGEPLRHPDRVEDYAIATIDLDGVAVRLACSWKLQAGRDAVIAVELYGRGGGAAVRNVGGSFYDFVAERYHGTSTERIVDPPDAWGGRALVDWARRLADGEGFDAAGGEEIVQVAEILDAIYGR